MGLATEIAVTTSTLPAACAGIHRILRELVSTTYAAPLWRKDVFPQSMAVHGGTLFHLEGSALFSVDVTPSASVPAPNHFGDAAFATANRLAVDDSVYSLEEDGKRIMRRAKK